MQISTYSQARDAGLPFYFTGKPCKRGHVAKKRTSNQCCTECEREKTAAWKLNNPEKARESNKKTKKKIYAALTDEEKKAGVEYRKNWRSENRDKVRGYVRKWKNANEERFAEIGAKWAKDNQARRNETAREWIKRNRAKANANYAIYRARKINASPSWLSKEQHDQMKKMYVLAKMVSKITGTPHDVDHIVPLSGKNVCGLHVPWNLQILPSSENIKKSNKHEES